MPRLRSQSMNPALGSRTRHKECQRKSSSNPAKAVRSGDRHLPSKPVLKERNSSTGRRRMSTTRNAGKGSGGKATMKTKPEVNRLRKENAVPKEEKDRTTSLTAKPLIVTHISFRDEKNEATEEKSKPDPYSLEALLGSDDEKENVDPNLVRNQTKKLKIKRQTTRRRNPFFVSASSSGHSHPPRLDIIKSPNPISSTNPAQAEHQRVAAATIYLPLPRAVIPPLLHATPISTHSPMASTPAVQSCAVYLVDACLPPTTSEALPSPLSTPVQPNAVLRPPPIASSPATDLVLSSGENKSHSKDRSSGSRSSRSSRKMSQSEREEAYSSWLDEFTAQLKQFESHELTVEEDKSST
ncbi:unnamed protein product [Calicophoron daubneyi]|uniref:Uncharacterized protein n=1 Tax=Calicophoron daubneyi TaxID=300641 RepID=A0AAV2TJK2_CALDB